MAEFGNADLEEAFKVVDAGRGQGDGGSPVRFGFHCRAWMDRTGVARTLDRWRRWTSGSSEEASMRNPYAQRVRIFCEAKGALRPIVIFI